MLDNLRKYFETNVHEPFHDVIMSACLMRREYRPWESLEDTESHIWAVLDQDKTPRAALRRFVSVANDVLLGNIKLSGPQHIA